jgi:hypothetical protein
MYAKNIENKRDCAPLTLAIYIVFIIRKFFFVVVVEGLESHLP